MRVSQPASATMTSSMPSRRTGSQPCCGSINCAVAALSSQSASCSNSPPIPRTRRISRSDPATKQGSGGPPLQEGWMWGWLRLKSLRRRMLGAASGYPAVKSNDTGSISRTPDGLIPAARQAFAISVRISTTASVAPVFSTRWAATRTTDGCASMRRSARRTGTGISSVVAPDIGSSVGQRLAADAGAGRDADGEYGTLDAGPRRRDLDDQRIVSGSVSDAFEFAVLSVPDVEILALGADAGRIVLIVRHRLSAGHDQGAVARLPERVARRLVDLRLLALVGPAVGRKAPPRTVMRGNQDVRFEALGLVLVAIPEPLPDGAPGSTAVQVPRLDDLRDLQVDAQDHARVVLSDELLFRR